MIERQFVVDEVRNLEVMTVNFGPQHPAAHGVLRLILECAGEVLIYLRLFVHQNNPKLNLIDVVDF